MFWNRKPKAPKVRKPAWVVVQPSQIPHWYVASTTSKAVSGPYGEQYAKNLADEMNAQVEASKMARR